MRTKPMRKTANTIFHLPIEYRGRIETLRDWCSMLGLEYSTVAMRYRRGIRVDTGLFRATPYKSRNSDLPSLTTRTQALRDKAYLPIFHLLSPQLRKTLTNHYNADINDINKNMVQQLDRALRVYLDMDKGTLHANPDFYALNNVRAFLPEPQRTTALRELGPSRTNELLSTALNALLGRAFERLSGIARDGSVSDDDLLEDAKGEG